MVMSRPVEKNYFQSSFFYKLSKRALDLILKRLYKTGDKTIQIFKNSIILNNLLAIIGIAIFAFLTIDAIVNDYTKLKTAVYLLIAFSALTLPLLKIIPDLFKGSKIISFFTWWVKTD